MFLTILTLATALALSIVAAYYSIVGLATIFAASVIPIIIMGTTMEVGKLVTTVWLHEHWNKCKLAMKTYLVFAVLVLMIITSMGIFGFLSKAHIQQTAGGIETIAQIDRLSDEVERQEKIIARAEQKINDLETSGTGGQSNIQSQIDIEQQRIDDAYKRADPLIAEQNSIIDSVVGLYQTQIDQIDKELSTLQGYIDQGGKENIKKAQAMVGAKADGAFGPNTANAFRAWQDQKNNQRSQLVTQVANLSNNADVITARQRIQQIRDEVAKQVDQSNKLINSLRDRLTSTNNNNNIVELIDEQQIKIREANNVIEISINKKFELESSYRELEAEVGPVKFIAALIYGEEASRNMLEDAVRAVIILLVIVFDPLAIMLLLAATESYKWHKEQLHEDSEKISELVSGETGKDHTDTNSESQPTGDDEKESPGDLEQDGDPMDQQSDEQDTDADQEGDSDNKEQIIYPEPEQLDIDEILAEERAEENFADDFVDIPDGNDSIEKSNEYQILPELAQELKQEAPLEFESETEVIDLGNGNVQYKNKEYNKEAFQEAYHDIIARPDDINEPHVGFGTTFPFDPIKGDMFIRVDYLPTRLFKHNGKKWIEVEKDTNTSILQEQEYISLLIEKLSDGTYDADMLSDHERDIVEQYLLDQEKND